MYLTLWYVDILPISLWYVKNYTLCHTRNKAKKQIGEFIDLQVHYNLIFQLHAHITSSFASQLARQCHSKQMCRKMQHDGTSVYHLSI